MLAQSFEAAFYEPCELENVLGAATTDGPGRLDCLDIYMIFATQGAAQCANPAACRAPCRLSRMCCFS